MLKRLLVGTVFLIALNPNIAIADPPEYLPQAQKSEWNIGSAVGIGRACGFHAQSDKVTTFMSNSPSFKQGLASVITDDQYRGCPQVKEILNKVLSDKQFWSKHIRGAYPEGMQTLTGEADDALTLENIIAVKKYIDESESSIKYAMSTYNMKHQILWGFWDNSQMYKVKTISSYTIKSAKVNEACVAFSVDVGLDNSRHGVLTLELRWAGDQVEIIGHDCR